MVSNCAVKDSRNEVVANALNLLTTFRSGPVNACRLSENRSFRINCNNLNVGVFFFKTTTYTRESSASSSAQDHVVDFAITLFPYFFSSFLVVRHRIACVFVLIEAVSVRKRPCKLNRNSNMTLSMVKSIGSWRANNSSTKTS